MQIIFTIGESQLSMQYIQMNMAEIQQALPSQFSLSEDFLHWKSASQWLRKL
jgi:hypothetical protein